MAPVIKLALQKCYQYLVDFLDSEDITSSLYERSIISDEDKSRISAPVIRQDRIRCLLDTLGKKDDHVIHFLLEYFQEKEAISHIYERFSIAVKAANREKGFKEYRSWDPNIACSFKNNGAQFNTDGAKITSGNEELEAIAPMLPPPNIVTTPLIQRPALSNARKFQIMALEELANEVPNLEGISWVSASDGELPEGGLLAGRDYLDKPLYVARCDHGGDIIPGKMAPANNIAYVGWDGGEHQKFVYQILVAPPDSVSWIPAAEGSFLPQNAIPCGITEKGEILYIGRVEHEGTVTLGKTFVPISRKILTRIFIPYDGQEHDYERFEILVKN